jgi:hypothetical protein
MPTKVMGTINKRIVNENGVCLPLYHEGDTIVP